MSMIILSIIAAAAGPAADTSEPLASGHWPRVVAEARRMDVPAITLERAIKAPQMKHWARHTKRYCYPLDKIEPGSSRMVCRTRSDWQALGLDPIDESI